jgi:hypothetical protein
LRRVCVVHGDLDGWLTSSVPSCWLYLARWPGHMYSRRRIQARVNQPQIGGR